MTAVAPVITRFTRLLYGQKPPYGWPMAGGEGSLGIGSLKGQGR